MGGGLSRGSRRNSASSLGASRPASASRFTPPRAEGYPSIEPGEALRESYPAPAMSWSWGSGSKLRAAALREPSNAGVLRDPGRLAEDLAARVASGEEDVGSTPGGGFKGDDQDGHMGGKPHENGAAAVVGLLGGYEYAEDAETIGSHSSSHADADSLRAMAQTSAADDTWLQRTTEEERSDGGCCARDEEASRDVHSGLDEKFIRDTRFESPRQSVLATSRTSIAVAAESTTLSPAAEASSHDVLCEGGGGIGDKGEAATGMHMDVESKERRAIIRETGADALVEAGETLTVQAGDWCGLVEREMQKCPMFEKLRVVCSTEEEEKLDQGIRSNWQRIAVGRWSGCVGWGVLNRGRPIIDAHCYGWGNVMRCTVPNAVKERGARPAHLLVCAVKPALMARLHILCGAFLGRWSATSASFSGNDERAAKDQFAQLSRPRSDTAVAAAALQAGPSSRRFWTAERRRLMLSISGAVRSAAEKDTPWVKDPSETHASPSKRKDGPLASQKRPEEQTKRNVKGFQAWAGVGSHPHIFPVARILGPGVALFPSLIGWVPLRQWMSDPAVASVLGEGEQRHLGCAFAALQISFALEHLHSSACLLPPRMRTNRLVNPFQNPVSLYVQGMEDELLGDSLCHLDVCPDNVVGWIVPQSAPGGVWGHARWGDLHLCLCDWSCSAERGSWKSGAEGQRGGASPGFRAPEQQTCERGGYWEDESPEGVVVMRMGERAVVEVGPGVDEMDLEWENGENGASMGQGRVRASQTREWGVHVSWLQSQERAVNCDGMQPVALIKTDEDEDDAGVENEGNTVRRRMVLLNDTGVCIVCHLWRCNKTARPVVKGPGPSLFRVGPHSDMWSWAMLTLHMFSCLEHASSLDWTELIMLLDDCAHEHEGKCGSGSAGSRAFGGRIAPFVCGIIRDCIKIQEPSDRPTAKVVCDRLMAALCGAAKRAGAQHESIAAGIIRPAVSCWRAATGARLFSDRHLELCRSGEVLCRTLYASTHLASLAAANRSCEAMCSRGDKESITAAVDQWRTLMVQCGSAVESQRMLATMLANSAAGYLAMGDAESGLRSFNEATSIRCSIGLVVPESADEAEIFGEKAAILALVGRGEEASRLQRERLRILRAFEKDGRDRVFANLSLAIACAESELACILEIAARYEEAITLHERAMTTFAIAEGDDCVCVKACEGGMQRCTSMMVKQALSGMDPKAWAREQELAERRRIREEAIVERQKREERRLRELERIKARGGKVVEHQLEHGQTLRIVLEGQMIVDDWDKMVALSGPNKRVTQSRIEGERCLEGAWNAIKRAVPAIEQAKFLFARAREALSTAGAVDMIERLKQLETKILEVESGEGPVENAVKRVVKGRVASKYEDASQGYRDGESDEGYSAEEDSDEEEKREMEERKRREEEEKQRQIDAERQRDLERQQERERRHNLSLRDIEFQNQQRQRAEAGGDQWSSWWNQDMSAVPDAQKYEPEVDEDVEAKKRAVEEKIKEEQRALYEAYLARQNK